MLCLALETMTYIDLLVNNSATTVRLINQKLPAKAVVFEI